MKTFDKTAAQGEAYFRRVERRPEGLKPLADKIVAHSETGHHHCFASDAAVDVLERTTDVPEGLRILHLIVREPSVLEHLRPTDTHEPILFPPGEYEVRLQREYTPEGFRAVQD